MGRNIRIRSARMTLGLTQRELAQQVGVARQTINAIERGGYNPSIKMCRAICKALDKTLDYLFWEDGAPLPP